MNTRYWAVVPAAGIGRRMGGAVPKQYLPLLDKTVIEWSLDAIVQDARIESVVVVLADNDTQWASLAIAKHPKIRVAVGGGERGDSVLAGLKALSSHARADDWVLVHDAARPCLTRSDLETLIEQLKDDQVGGLLATPLADTLKQSDTQQRVSRTVPRDGLWRALTPQMFRFALLYSALEHALAKGWSVTDESSAIETSALKPRLIAGRIDNLKITMPEDLNLAFHILVARQRVGGQL